MTMIALSKNDYFQVKLVSLIADYDIETVVSLYSPIVGFEAVMIYLALYNEFKKQEILSISSHDDIFLSLKMAPGVFVESRKKLEAVALLKTFRKKLNGSYLYTYCLKCPKTPKSFFQDPLLYGLLTSNVKEENASRLKRYYCLEKLEELGEDISSHFKDEFNANVNNSSFIQSFDSNSGIIDRSHAKIDLPFDIDLFFAEIKSKSQIDPNSIPKTIVKRIARISSLYGVAEDIASEEFIALYNPIGLISSRLDFDAFSKAISKDSETHFFLEDKKEETTSLSGTSDLTRLINLMEESSPRFFLKYIQNGVEPSSADMRLIDNIIERTHLNHSVINVLINLTLNKCNNILSSSYMEKVASSLVRNKITTALDAVNYINEIEKKKKRKKYSYKDQVASFEKEKKDDINDSKEETISDDEWDKMILESEK